MADGVHAGVHTMQPAGCDPMANSARAQPDLDELAQRHDTVLRRRALGDSSLQHAAWFETVHWRPS